MGVKTEVQGGGKAKGVGKDFLAMIGEMINSSAGAGAGDVGGVRGALSALLAGPNQGGLDSIRSIQEKQKAEDLASLRAQFGTNTSSRGTPAAAAMSTYLSNRSPQDTLTETDYMDKNRITALQLLLPLFSQAVNIGTPQAQLVQKPTLGQNLLGAATGISTAASQFIHPSFSSMAGVSQQGAGPSQFANFSNWGRG